MEQWAGQFRVAFVDFLDYTTQFQTLTDKGSLTMPIFILWDTRAAKLSLSVSDSPSEIQESPFHSTKVTERQRSSSDLTTLRQKKTQNGKIQRPQLPEYT
jgi:hypothetical protein